MTTAERTTPVTPSAAIDPRHAYEHGMPLHVLCRRFHLSDGEARELVPEEFGDDAQAGAVSGY